MKIPSTGFQITLRRTQKFINLVSQNKIIGNHVHDIRLVAIMLSHGIKNIITFNDKDFAALEVKVFNPTKLVL